MCTGKNERTSHNILSVIIPTLRPVSELSHLLASIDVGLWSRDEVVVVQASQQSERGFEIEGTAHRMRVLLSPRGRGIQLNRGAAASRGDLLFFLHDDCRISEGYAGDIRSTCADPRVSLGCFSLAFRPSTRPLDWIAAWARLRTRWLRMPYGDQGLFCRREVWERAGGFKKPFLMEDVDFVRECRKLGRIIMLERRIHTSPGRYMEYGVWRASFRNHMNLLRYCLGEDDRRLYAQYYVREGMSCSDGSSAFQRKLEGPGRD